MIRLALVSRFTVVFSSEGEDEVPWGVIAVLKVRDV